MAEIFGIIAGGIQIADTVLRAVSTLAQFVQSAQHFDETYNGLHQKAESMRNILTSLHQTVGTRMNQLERKPLTREEGNLINELQGNIEKFQISLETHASEVLGLRIVSDEGWMMNLRQQVRYENRYLGIRQLHRVLDGYVNHFQILLDCLQL